jgi:F420-dependent oxidoreductase-like protein
MRIGLQIIRFDWPGSPQNLGPTLANIATTADQAGFASLWVMDHLFQMGDEFGPADAPMLEGYSTITYLAARTSQIHVGVLVTGNVYRHPGLLIKTVSTLDVLSGGRAYLGIGAGWYEREARGLGLPFPPLNERFERLEETLQIAKHMWRGDRSPYVGRYYCLTEPINCPQPLRRPSPPILIGGDGERRTLRLVAQYGDACNLYLGATSAEFAEGLPRIQHKLTVLQQHCQTLGRVYEEIERTVLATVHLAPGHMQVDEIVQLCRSLAAVGIQHVIFNMPNVHEIAPLEVFGEEIIPIVASYD